MSPIYPDSIDLQDREAPSAQDHPRPNKSTSNGPHAPHQAETLREVAAETAEENLRSPRVSWVGGEVGDLQQYAEDLAAGVTNSLNSQPTLENHGPNNMAAGQQQDALAIAQNGGLSGQEADDGDLDADADDGMDDDMMDKISSSPSIEDGGSICTLPPLSLRKVGSSCPPSTLCSLATSPTPSDARSFSPYLDHPKHFPLSMSDQKAEEATFELPSRHHHLQCGEFSTQDRPTPLDESTPSNHDRYRRNNWPAESETTTSVLTEIMAEMERLEQEATAGDDVLDDDCWDDGMEDAVLHRAAEQKLEDVDEAIGDIEQDDLTIPYESSDEDDDGDFSDIQDTRFLDSGWGGDCLQDTEDIDFEFVYALHTFVATVEGQANATKGDTMVLLDDSNSYWWLVRVVKDSSIGTFPPTLAWLHMAS